MISQELEKKVLFYRRDFHKHPETAWSEFRTASLIAEYLYKMGYKDLLFGSSIFDFTSVMGRPDENIIDHHIGRAIRQGAIKEWIDKMERHPGVMAVLDTKRSGPTVTLRFDLDAVDITETKDPAHRPVKEGFASVHDGAMHACGHDGHAAMGLGIAELIIEHSNSLTGTYKLIFQPAEEGVRGAKAMADKGILDDCDYFIAIHLGMSHPTGKVTAGAQGFLCTTKFDVRYTGVSAHAGAAPENGRNALLAACAAALNMHAIAPHGKGISRINVGVLQAGEGRNVVPPNAFMKVETRGATEEIETYMYSRAREIIDGAAKMYGVESVVYETGAATTARSSNKIVDIIANEAVKVDGITEIEKTAAAEGSDDATWMMKRVQNLGGQATYILVGSNLTAGHHNEYFDFDERSLFIGVDLIFKTLQAIAKNGARS